MRAPADALPLVLTSRDRTPRWILLATELLLGLNRMTPAMKLLCGPRWWLVTRLWKQLVNLIRSWAAPRMILLLTWLPLTAEPPLAV